MVRIPFPQPFGPPPSISSVTNNYMTIEEVREFMLNEQKVCFKISINIHRSFLSISKHCH